MLNLVPQTLIGFDFGLKHIGVAVGQTLTCTAAALPSLQAKQGAPDLVALDKLINTWRPHALVVGIPYLMDGKEQPLTHAARRFAKALRQRYHLVTHTMDERLSTAEARAQLFAAGGYRALSKAAIDGRSAQLILQSWLQSQAS